MDTLLRPVSALWAALVTLAGPASAQDSTPVTRDSLEHIVRDRVATGRSPGLIVGVITPDGSSYTVAAGSARSGKPVDDRTLFEIGSITKAFTGILLAEMVGRGEVQFGQPVAELLPPGTAVPSRNGRTITLLDLSTQTSGLPRLPDNLKPADPTNPYADYTPALMYDFLKRHELRRDPGALYEYSNLGAGLLGHALALRAGKSYEGLMRERILAPLGMTSTGIVLTDGMRALMSEGHDGAGTVVPLWDIPTLAGAGALRSSMSDMMRFLAANMNPADDPLGRAIAASHEARFQVNSAMSLGLNWHRPHFRGDTLVFHNGGTAGFRTIIAFNPRTRTGAVLLGNSSQDNEDIVRHLLMGTPLVTPVIRNEIAVAPDSLEAYVGTYHFAPQFAITITREGGRLYAQATDQPKFQLFAEARDKFFLKVVDAQLEFTRNATGAVTGATLVQGGRNVGRKVK